MRGGVKVDSFYGGHLGCGAWVMRRQIGVKAATFRTGRNEQRRRKARQILRLMCKAPKCRVLDTFVNAFAVEDVVLSL
jgi:hypothetical protein